MVYMFIAYLATTSVGAGAGAWIATDRPISGALIGALTGAGVRWASLLLHA